MATTSIPWGDGSGDNIYLTYPSASGDQTVEVSSDANTGAARSKVVTFASGVGNIQRQLTVNQAAGVVSVPYIRGGADGSYIDTGITPDNTTRIVLWARNVNPGTAFNWVFGSRVANQNAAFALAIRNEGGTGGIRACFGNENVNLTDKWPLLSHYHKYELSVSGFYVDDVLAGGVTSSTFSNNYNLYLFGLNNAGSYSALGRQADICACKIYKGGVLVRDYTAVNSPSVGLYDAVSGTVFTNSGTGSFTYGTFNPDAYTPLEYITSSGAQYFDTGIKGGYAIPAVIKFRYTTTSLNRYLFGCRNGTTSKCDLSLGGTSVKNCIFNYQSASALGVYSGSSTLRNRDLVFVKNNNVFTLYENNSQLGTKTGATGSTFVTDYNMYVANLNTAGTPYSYGYVSARYYYLGFGASRNYVPAKVNGVAGMYDTYNDVFYPSATETAFTAGPEL